MYKISVSVVKWKGRVNDDNVECALKEWFLNVRDKDARVSGPLLRIGEVIELKNWQENEENEQYFKS